jgi:hypothetical protein
MVGEPSQGSRRFTALRSNKSRLIGRIREAAHRFHIRRGVHIICKIEVALLGSSRRSPLVLQLSNMLFFHRSRPENGFAENAQIRERISLEFYIFTLFHFQVRPTLASERRCVLAPDRSGAIFVCDVYIFLALSFPRCIACRRGSPRSRVLSMKRVANHKAETSMDPLANSISEQVWSVVIKRLTGDA